MDIPKLIELMLCKVMDPLGGNSAYDNAFNLQLFDVAYINLIDHLCFASDHFH